MFFRILPLLILVGCTTTETEYVDRPVEVKVPVLEPCLESMPEQPDWETERLEPDDSIGLVGQAYRIERKQREQYVERVESGLAGCVKED